MKEAGSVLYGIYVLLTIWLLLNGIVQLHLLCMARQKRYSTAEVARPASICQRTGTSVQRKLRGGRFAGRFGATGLSKTSL